MDNESYNYNAWNNRNPIMPCNRRYYIKAYMVMLLCRLDTDLVAPRISKPSPKDVAIYKRTQPMMMDSINRAGGVLPRKQVVGTYSEGAIQQAISDKVVAVVKIRYTDKTNAKPPEQIDCICTESWDRKTKPTWLP